MVDRPDIDAIRARWEATTPGEWTMGGVVIPVIEDAQGRELGKFQVTGGDYAAVQDSTFCAHAHQDIPALLAYIDDLEQRLAETPPKP